MKVGTLVMLINKIGTDQRFTVPVGAVGEVISTENSRYTTGEPVDKGRVGVVFSKHKCNSSTGGWAVFRTNIVPLSDPDADVTTSTIDELDKEIMDNLSYIVDDMC